jgi:acetyl esterase
VTGRAEGESWQDRARRLSPIAYARAGLPPTLLIHGDGDDVVPVEQADRFARALREHGNAVVFHRRAGWPHAFAVMPRAPADERVEETLRMIEAFLAEIRHIAPADRPRSRAQAAPSPPRRSR